MVTFLIMVQFVPHRKHLKRLTCHYCVAEISLCLVCIALKLKTKKKNCGENGALLMLMYLVQEVKKF